MNLKQYLYHQAVVYGFHDGLFHEYERALKEKYYNKKSCSVSSCVVFMVDGRSVHGGLADRLKGIVSIFSLCQKYGKDFKLKYDYPFDISDYLVANEYDWSLSETNIEYGNKSLPVLINDYQLPVRFHEQYFKRCLKKTKQLHVYSNSPLVNEQFGKLFMCLFKPSVKLQESIDENLKKIGGQYISVTYRFQALLGDFKEGEFPVLSTIDRQKLIKICKEKLICLSRENRNYILLVTSDSKTFLNEVSNMENIYIIPGDVVHMDYVSDGTYKVYEKSFLDFFMIGNACKSYLIYGRGLYHSGFAKQASLLNNHIYKEIKLK